MDQVGARLDPTQLAGADQTSRLRRQSAVNGHEIRRFHQFVETDEPCSGRFDQLQTDVWVIVPAAFAW